MPDVCPPGDASELEFRLGTPGLSGASTQSGWKAPEKAVLCNTDIGCIHSYDLPAPRRNALSQPRVWPVSGSQMGGSRLQGDSTAHGFASAVVDGASIAGLRGEFWPGNCADWLAPAVCEIGLPRDRAAHTGGRQWPAHELQVCRQGSLVSRWSASAIRVLGTWLRED